MKNSKRSCSQQRSHERLHRLRAMIKKTPRLSKELKSSSRFRQHLSCRFYKEPRRHACSSLPNKWKLFPRAQGMHFHMIMIHKFLVYFAGFFYKFLLSLFSVLTCLHARFANLPYLISCINFGQEKPQLLDYL
uniref:Uncharacterized protein n=1 Tax=Noccaea caerulescens TaxID=107243 RepID=A0A1J3IED0_NOCCA